MSTPEPNPPANAARPRIGTACAVVAGCGLAGLVAVGVLIYLAVTLFNQIGGDNPEGGGSGKRGPRPGPVLPTRLAGDRATVELPGLVDGVCRAAGGRYLVLRAQNPGRLVVFDPNAAAVVKTLDLEEPNSLFAGTASKLFVYRPKALSLDRYDLVSWERERSVAKPARLKSVDTLVAGPGSDGPVLLVGDRSQTSGDLVTVDADTLKAGAVRETNWPNGTVRVSHDGRLVGVTAAGGAGGGVLLRFGPGGSVEESPVQVPRGLGHLAPSPDGRFAYTAVGVYDRDGARTLSPTDGYFYTLPTAQGSDLFVSIPMDATGAEPVLREPIRLHLADDARPLADLPGRPPGVLSFRIGREPPLRPDMRVHLWPAAGLLALISASQKAIELYKVDVPALLKKSGKDYLVIGSDPPTTAVRGATWSYQPAVWSSGGTPTVGLNARPPGMAADPKGTITWPVPADFPDSEVEVRLEVADGGRKAEQVFHVVLTDG